MWRPTSRLWFSALVLVECLACGDPSEIPTRPNVVLLLADDLGYGDVAFQGAPDIETPNLDRLAADGARFQHAYAASPVCSPTRVALLTGRYPQRLGPWFEDYGTPGLDPSRHPTLGTWLREAGYATALFGKWNVAGKRQATGPNDHGFDRWVGTHHNHNYHSHLQLGSGRPDFYVDGEPTEISGYTTDILAAQAVRFIEESGDAPFFMFVSWLSPHYPLQVPEARRVWPRTRRDVYVRMVEHLDRRVGDILGALDRRGVERETLVIFTSDNGGAPPARNQPFRGRKQGLEEGGIRVPLVLRWPGVIPPGTQPETPAITMDLTATILSVAGAMRADLPPLDGIDLLPLLDEQAAPPDRTLFWRRRRVAPRENVAPVAARAVRQGDWKLLLRAGAEPELYDVRSDPGETSNRSEAQPERLARLRDQLLAWEKEMPAENQ